MSIAQPPPDEYDAEKRKNTVEFYSIKAFKSIDKIYKKGGEKMRE